MFRILLCLQIISVVLCIIVTDAPPVPHEYKYSYFIDDPTTGDSKSQHEIRQGGIVSGVYTVLEPDGVKRTVEYTAHPKTGFKAVIRREPISESAPLTFQVKNYNLRPDNYNGRSETYNLIAPRYTQVSTGQSVSEKVPLPYFKPGNVVKNEPGTPGQYFVPSINRFHFPQK